PRRELADHRVSNRHKEQFTYALQHVIQEQPHERTLPVCAGQLDPERENEKGGCHQKQRRRELLRNIDSPPARAHPGKERSEYWTAKYDANGVDVLNPLRLNRHGTDHQIDVVDREQHQTVRRHLIKRPEHQRADRQNQVRRHVSPLAKILVADGEIDQRESDCGGDSLEDRLGSAGSLEHKPDDGNNGHYDADAGELAHLELLWRGVEKHGVPVGERLPREQHEDDGDEIAKRRKNKEARVTLGGLEITGGAEPDEETDIHAGVVPEECAFAARIFRSEALRQHHVDASDVESAAGEEEGEADEEWRQRAGRDAGETDPLQCNASDKQLAFEKEATAEVTAEEVKAVVERAEHTHQRCSLLYS